MEKGTIQRLNDWKENLIEDIIRFCKTHKKLIYFDYEFETYIEQPDHNGIFFIRHFIIGLTSDGLVIARNAEEIEEEEYKLTDLSIECITIISDELEENHIVFNDKI